MTTPAGPADLLHDVQAVLAAAYAYMTLAGWQREAPARTRPDPAHPSPVRVVDALNAASALAYADAATHRLAFACAAMAVTPTFGIAPHELLPDALADAYLSPSTTDDTLHRLDASIMVRCNADLITSAADAAELLRLAGENAEQVVAAQVRYARPVQP